MKYGVLFFTLGLLLAGIALSRGGWYWLMLWPAVSLAIVASGYLGLGPCVFGMKLNAQQRACLQQLEIEH